MGIKTGNLGFGYDLNGNMVTDGTRAATLTYNYLNLPQTVTIAGKTQTYDYDATGVKHKYVADTLILKYAGIFEYRKVGNSNKLYRISLAEGQAVYRNGKLDFDYYLKDHLGNTRVVFDGKGNILQKTDYYPFGLGIARDVPAQTAAVRNAVNRYHFLGNERQVGTGYIDLQARFYDPGIGRFLQVDPLAEKGRRWSPYTYGFDNPLRFIDPDGMWPWSVNVRSFISAKSAGLGTFYADNRGPSFTGTSRVNTSFTVDPTKGTISNLEAKSSPTIFFPTLTVKTGTPKASITNEKYSEGSASFNFSHSGKDPITPEFATPALDVHAKLSFNEDMKKGILNISGSFTGDQFPSTEAFVTDQSGKTKVFLGAQMEQGGVGDLYGDNKQPLFNVNMQVNFDNKGNFTGVTQGKTTYSVSDWNKKVQEGFNK